MSEREILKPTILLKDNGTLTEEGFARKPYFIYEREKIKASKIRIKEWDYYAILDKSNNYVVCMTFSDLGFAGLFALALIDYKTKKAIQSDTIKLFTLHKTGLASSSSIDNTIAFSSPKFSFKFSKNGSQRHIEVNAPNFTPNPIFIDAIFSQPDDKETINIATSWKENRKAFYLNEKAIAMTPLSGFVQIGNRKDDICIDKSTLILDWGRGRWTRENTWYWAAASGFYNDIPFGFNLGYGFSDRLKVSENAFFFNNRLHKLNKVEFKFNSYMDNWEIKDNEGRLNLTFKPVVPRISNTNLAIIVSKQNQIFGYFDGKVKLDNGEEIKITNLMGFAEEVYNKW